MEISVAPPTGPVAPEDAPLAPQVAALALQAAVPASPVDLGFVIEFCGSRVSFRDEEVMLYTRLFRMIDCDDDGLVQGAEGAAFIRRARLPNDINREIWRLSCGGRSVESLNRESWFVAMKLVALAQDTGSCSLEPILAGEDFMLNSQPHDRVGQVVPRKEETISCFWRVRIKEPVIVGSGYSRYTEYAVEAEVDHPRQPTRRRDFRRRFSDFEWMHLRLVSRFPGLIIPPLPEKRSVGNLEVTFVEERKQALEHYINQVANHPQLGSALEVQVILTASREGLQAAKELMPMETATIPISAPSSAVTNLFHSLKSSIWAGSPSPLDVKPDEEYLAIGRRVDAYEAKLAEACRTVDNWYRKLRELGYELSRFGHYLTELAIHEREDEAESEFLQIVGERLESEGNLLQDHLDAELADFVTPVRYQYGKVGSVKAVMANRENAVEEVVDSNASMQRNKERFAAARARTGTAGSALKAEQKVVQAEGRMNEARLQVEFITESLKREMNRFEREKNEEFKGLLLAHAKHRAEHSRQCRQSFEQFLRDIHCTETELNESSNRTTRPVPYPIPGQTKEQGPLSTAKSALPFWG